MKLDKDFVNRLKNIFISKGINQITFGLDVFDDMDDMEYLTFSQIYNRYDTRKSVQNTID